MDVVATWQDPDFAGRPMPEPDSLSSEYWAAAAAGELRYQECPACGHRQFYPRLLCVVCCASPAWRVASGRGVVHTFSVVRRNLAPPFDRLSPYVVAIIELAEGPRMMGNVVGCDVDLVRVGMDVEAFAVLADKGIGVPFWRPGMQ